MKLTQKQTNVDPKEAKRKTAIANLEAHLARARQLYDDCDKGPEGARRQYLETRAACVRTLERQLAELKGEPPPPIPTDAQARQWRHKQGLAP
jgi:hypothetical protein